ncbi:MAG: hypothetical protein E7355_02960 [Clostridiales bacterium]|nr:hypothetical protein [Clostridiales bacterium]
MGKFVEKLKKAGYAFFGEKRWNKIINKRARRKNPERFEHFECFGDLNPDKTIYLIRKPYSIGEGLLSIFVYVMGRIDYADRNGMIPFVDLEQEGVPSRFARYFTLKTDLTREEVYQSKNVLLSGNGEKPVYPGWCNWINTEFNEQKYALFEKYVAFSDVVLEKLEEVSQKILPEKCLGLYMRGTDYFALKPGGHPIQPTFEDLVDKIEEFLEREGLERIFLVTEDINMYQKAKERYGEKIFILDENEFVTDYKSGEMILEAAERKGSIDEINMTYLLKIILLSKCACFVGGRTNGSSVANALNGGKYKQRFVYDVGYY